MHAWCLEIAFVWEVGMRVCLCVSTPESISNLWHWLDKFCSFMIVLLIGVALALMHIIEINLIRVS